MKVLLTDDSPTMRKIQKQVLAKIGISDFIEAGDGTEALKKIIEHNFEIDLIICDINMPIMSGIETLRRIRNNPKTAKMPVIMCTSVTENDLIKQAISAGANGYIIKPVIPEALIKKVNEIIKKNQGNKIG